MAIDLESLCNSCRVNSYIRNSWASDIINPDKMHSASAPSLSEVASTSANEAAETIMPEWKNIKNTLNRSTSSFYGQMVKYFASRTVNVDFQLSSSLNK